MAEFLIPFKFRVGQFGAVLVMVLLATVPVCQTRAQSDSSTPQRQRSVATKKVQDRSIAVGSAFPDFALKDQNGNLFRLSAKLEQGPVVLVFFRSADW